MPNTEHRRLRALGAAIQGEPEMRPWSDRSFFLSDAAGICLCICTPGYPVAPEFKAGLK